MVRFGLKVKISCVAQTQVAPHVHVRDLVVARRPSTAPAAGAGGNRRQQQQQQKRGKQGISGDDDGGVSGNKGLEAFLSLDHSVQVIGQEPETVGLACPFRVHTISVLTKCSGDLCC